MLQEYINDILINNLLSFQIKCKILISLLILNIFLAVFLFVFTNKLYYLV